MSKLFALLSHSRMDATPAPTRPIAPRGAIGMRSPGSRKASATMAAMAAATTHAMGMIALSECQFIAGPRATRRVQKDAIYLRTARRVRKDPAYRNQEDRADPGCRRRGRRPAAPD